MNALALKPARCQRTPALYGGAAVAAVVVLTLQTQRKNPLRTSRRRARAMLVSRLLATSGFSLPHHAKAKDKVRSTGSSNL